MLRSLHESRINGKKVIDTNMGFYKCPYILRSGAICNEGCYRPEGCKIHWKRRQRVPCKQQGGHPYIITLLPIILPIISIIYLILSHKKNAIIGQISLCIKSK